MEELDKVLSKLEELLEIEKELAINSINDTQVAQKLLELAEEKQQTLSQLANFTKDDALTKKDRIEKIYSMMKINQEIILNNLRFIEDLFEAIFDTTKTYSPEGSVKSPSDGFINKKV